MPASALLSAAVPSTYRAPRRRVENSLVLGQQGVGLARLRTYWETGQLIDQHLFMHKDRAEYGEKLIPRLAEDSRISGRLLYQCARFARAFPILHARAELTWAHYRLLAQVADNRERKTIEVEAARNNWTSRQLESHIRPLGAMLPADRNGSDPGDKLKSKRELFELHSGHFQVTVTAYSSDRNIRLPKFNAIPTMDEASVLISNPRVARQILRRAL